MLVSRCSLCYEWFRHALVNTPNGRNICATATIVASALYNAALSCAAYSLHYDAGTKQKKEKSTFGAEGVA